MKLWGKPAILLAVLLVMSGCSVPSQAEPDIQAKADAFSTQVATDMAAKAKAAAEARIIKLEFPTDRPLRVFYAGDSLSYSLYSSTEAKGYRPLVTHTLMKSGEVSEARATKADPKALFKAGNAQNIPASGVDLAIIELGTNDTTQKTKTDQFQKDYEALLDKVQRSKGAQLICVGTWGGRGPTITDLYDFIIERVCLAHGGQYVDLTAAYESEGTYGPEGAKSWLGPSDNFHPNDKGHRMIADLILERITVVRG